MSMDPESRDEAASGDITRWFRRLGPAAILLAAWTLLPALCGFVLLAELGAARDLLDAQGDLAIVYYVTAFALTAGLGLLPTYAQAVLGGWVFGVGRGFGAALAGFVAGALLGYAVARIVAAPRVAALLAAHPRATAVRDALLRRGQGRETLVVSLLRLPPNSPFAAANLAMASAGVALLPYTVGTLLGMAPRTFVFVAAAATAADTGARDIQAFTKDFDGFALLVAGIVTMLAVLALLSHLARRGLAQLDANPGEAPR
jgi:uncharacterized membrane protein YdjX (TVP38/TMEM64 family)